MLPLLSRMLALLPPVLATAIIRSHIRTCAWPFHACLLLLRMPLLQLLMQLALLLHVLLLLALLLVTVTVTLS
jgi:hypothetical protein